jgi:redox-sensing transcriptional repressor
MKNGKVKAPAPVIRRLSNYHHLLLGMRERRVQTVTSTTLAEILEVKPIQVRKDLQMAGIVGRPRTGFNVEEMEVAISKFMGWTSEFQAVIFGAGNLGSALMNYPWRDEYGLRFIAAFESDPVRSNVLINNIPVFHIDYFEMFAREHTIDVGVVAVPAEAAQAVAELLMQNGVSGIWNFSHTTLKITGRITVENALFTQSLAILTRRLVESRTQSTDGATPGVNR